MVLTREINIIETSSAELFSAVLYRALACIGMHWRALACSGMHWHALACAGVLWRALACTGVLWRALACTGVLWRALLCRTQVFDNRTPLPDKRTHIT
jgi:hypothetical protein